MNSLQQILELSPASKLELADFLSALSGSLIASAIAFALYTATYGRQNIGAGVQRMFLLGGPSITALLLAIQFSLPLSLGLLGALSIVRFRAPIKGPAEMGFLLLLIAGAIGCATFNYWLVVVLYGIACVVLLLQRLSRFQTESGRSSLIISAEDPAVGEKELAVSTFVAERLNNADLMAMSTLGGRTQLHYQFNRLKGFDWGHFKRDLDEIVGPAKAELHVS
jgi:hypothetical protein